MTPPRGTRAIDAPSLYYEIGRQVQAMSLMMRRHRIVDTQQICECGRPPVRRLPVFGPRCEVASESWSMAHEAMRRRVDQDSGRSRAVGRVVMHPAVRRA